MWCGYWQTKYNVYICWLCYILYLIAVNGQMQQWVQLFFYFVLFLELSDLAIGHFIQNENMELILKCREYWKVTNPFGNREQAAP